MRKLLVAIISVFIIGGLTTGCNFFEDKSNIKSQEQAQKDLENAKNEVKLSVEKTAKATWESVQAQYELDEAEGKKIPKTKKTFEELYNIYSQKLEDECNNSSINRCNEIVLEAFENMAQRLYDETGPSGDMFYDRYEEWTSKLIDLYMNYVI